MSTRNVTRPHRLRAAIWHNIGIGLVVWLAMMTVLAVVTGLAWVAGSMSANSTDLLLDQVSASPTLVQVAESALVQPRVFGLSLAVPALVVFINVISDLVEASWYAKGRSVHV